MSPEQIKEAEKSTRTTQSEGNKWGAKSIIFTFMILSLLATWGYIIWDKNNTKEIINQKDANTAALTDKKERLQKELEDITHRYDDIKYANIQKDSVIIARDQEIVIKQNRIGTLLAKEHATSLELAEARELIESLKNDINGYENELASLKLKNSELNSMNDKLLEQRDKVRKDFDSSVLEIKNRDNIIDIGSTLQASNFNLIPLDERKSGKIVQTNKAKRVDKLRISFDLDVNLIAKSGTKQFFIIISDPSGKVISDFKNGTSTFNDREGRSLTYTQSMEVNYVQNKRQTISFDWSGAGKFEQGTYKIEVYHNGFKIGEGNRPLNK